MKKFLLLSLALAYLTLGFFNFASAHPGRTDANGGHTCRTNCVSWGLKNGQYHKHGGGKAAKKSTKKAKKASKKVTRKNTRRK